ncbi:MAG: hypothetical protein Q7T01_04340 [bacterium]|nr:hypothetical protein [bacterium]
MSDSCAHCLPTVRRGHGAGHVQYWIEWFLRPFLWFGFWGGAMLPVDVRVRFRMAVCACLRALRVLTLDDDVTGSAIFERSRMFLREAQERGLRVWSVRLFGRRLANEFAFRYRGRTYHFEGTPLHVWAAPRVDVDDKAAVKRVLAAAGIPVSSGRAFRTRRAAQRYGEQFGYPLVVKPINGSLGHHVTTGITDRGALEEAIAIAYRYCPMVLVERHIPGSLYRVTVLDGQHVFACRKDPASVSGDGRSTIRELVTALNAQPGRGARDNRGSTLHVVACDEIMAACLRRQGSTFDDVPGAGDLVALHDRALLTLGCSITSVTDQLHPANRALFCRAAATLGVTVVGFDVIAQDLARPADAQPFGIIEANSLPYLDMHANPSHGQPDPIAATCWDGALARLEASRGGIV